MRGVATVTIAVSISGATYLSAEAGDRWQDALRDQIKWSAAVENDVRRVYVDEAPIAWHLEFTETVARYAGAAAVAPDIAGAFAEIKAKGHDLAVAQMRAAHAGTDHLLGSDRYEMADGGQDLPRRLADLRDADSVSTGAGWEAGDRIFPNASLLAMVPALFATLQLFFALVGRLRARRRRMVAHEQGSGHAGSFTGVIFPAPDQSPVRRRRFSLSVILRRTVEAVPMLAWLLLTVLPIAQVHYTKQEQRDHQVAAGQALTISTVLACSGMRASFIEQANQMVLVEEAISLGDQIAALDAGDPEVAEVVMASAEDEAMWAELVEISRSMGRVPTVADGLDPSTVEVLTAGEQKIDRLSAQQRSTADFADAAGRKAHLLNLAIFLAALAGARRSNTYGAFGRTASLIVLCGAVVAGAWAHLF